MTAGRGQRRQPGGPGASGSPGAPGAPGGRGSSLRTRTVGLALLASLAVVALAGATLLVRPGGSADSSPGASSPGSSIAGIGSGKPPPGSGSGSGSASEPVATPGPSAVASSALTGAAGFVRVDQVGYELDTSGSRHRAFLLAPVPATGTSFQLVADDGSVVESAAVPTQSLGSWNDQYGFVYPLDFSGALAGTYRILVSGSVAGISPPFRIDTATNLYQPLLSNALAFYQAQRDGPDVVSTVMNREPSHLNDTVALTYAAPIYNGDGILVKDLHRVGGPIDASGGWADAGDYVKFVQTTSYVVDVMLAGIRDQPSLAGPDSGADFTAEARFGLDWLQKMWDDKTRTLYYQVGIGDGNDTILGDHDLWRLPEVDDTVQGADPAAKYLRHRPVFRAGVPGAKISPNLAGRLSAAFAECSQVFRASDPAYADRCLIEAEHVYALADTKPKTLLTVAPFDFYPETQWRDDMELGAIEIAKALNGLTGAPPAGLPSTDSHAYIRASAHWAAAYVHGPKDFDSLNLYDVAGLAHYELALAIGLAGDPTDVEILPSALIADMKARLDSAVARAARDPFGFGGDFTQFDSAAHALGLATMASEVDELTSSTDYAAFGRRQLDVVLGSNAWGTSLIVGAGTTFPHCIHHQIANLVGSLDGSSPLLLGAVVNGPNAPQDDLGLPDGADACSTPGFSQFDGHGSVFLDDAGSWPTVEPSLDYSVGQVLAFARAAAGLR